MVRIGTHLRSLCSVTPRPSGEGRASRAGALGDSLASSVLGQPRRGNHRFKSRGRRAVPPAIAPMSARKTQICRDTSPTLALSGASNRAAALFLNASPYRAIFHPYRPPVPDPIDATPNLTRGVPADACQNDIDRKSHSFGIEHRACVGCWQKRQLNQVPAAAVNATQPAPLFVEKHSDRNIMTNSHAGRAVAHRAP